MKLKKCEDCSDKSFPFQDPPSMRIKNSTLFTFNNLKSIKSSNEAN